MEEFASKLLPLVISSAVFILSAIKLGRDILSRDEQGVTATEGETGGEKGAKGGWLGYLAAGAWGVGFFLAIYLLGFMIAIPLFVLAYMKSHGTRWFVAITFAVLTPLLIYGVFELALRVTLFRGSLFAWLGC
jgi:hypothetical protein